MDIVNFWWCNSNMGWGTDVPSSSGGTYTVKFEELPPNAPYQYGFTCTCPGFKFGKGIECKHIKLAKPQFCGWHQQHDGGEPKDRKCPKCGGPVSGVRCAV